MTQPVVGQSSAVRASTRAHYYANRRRHAVILRAPFVTGTEPWLTFNTDPLNNGLSFYSFRNPEGEIFECGIGDDYAQALVELHKHLSHAP